MSRGFTLRPLQREQEVGLLPSPIWAGNGPRSLPRAGVLLEQRQRELLAFGSAPHVNGCRVRFGGEGSPCFLPKDAVWPICGRKGCPRLGACGVCLPEAGGRSGSTTGAMRVQCWGCRWCLQGWVLLSQDSSHSGGMCQHFAHQTWHRLSPRRGLDVPGALGGVWLPVFTHSSDGGTGGSVP